MPETNDTLVIGALRTWWDRSCNCDCHGEFRVRWLRDQAVPLRDIKSNIHGYSSWMAISRQRLMFYNTNNILQAVGHLWVFFHSLSVYCFLTLIVIVKCQQHHSSKATPDQSLWLPPFLKPVGHYLDYYPLLASCPK